MRTLLNLALAVFFAAVLGVVLRTYVFTLIQVRSVSMEETLKPGDIVVMTRFDYWLSLPARGDIVAFTTKGDASVTFKRVVGAQEDTIELNKGVVSLDGEVLTEDYVTNNDDQTFLPIEIPVGYSLVLGDNRGQSIDSRDEEIGLIAQSQIEGRARYIIWPRERMGIIK